ncbi:hypothetical protein EDD11_010314 [Mortierella claussenii]|nr:hypothetical protein EDD11_010314 [Mortierella claussenii]
MEYDSFQNGRPHGDTAVTIPAQNSSGNYNSSSESCSWTIPEKGWSATKKRDAVQRSLGFKNIVIYVLLFLNFVLLTKLASGYWRPSPTSPPQLFAQGKGLKHSPDDDEHDGGDATSADFWLKMALIVFLVMLGGIFAGLTIGLMGLDETNLHVLMASGTPTEQVHAETVFTLLSRGKHWVLGNVIVNETLPVVLDSELGGGVVAILISTMLIVVFGEIIPQAVCARHGLAIGSYCAKPMMIFMYIMSPIAYPIAMVLDSWLGVHHGTTYRRTELKTLVSLHQMDGIGELTDDEVTIIASVLDLKEKSVSQVMTPLEDVFTLSEDAILDEDLMEEIVSAGYSRIPIYRHDDPSNFIGMLLVKRLITYDPEDHIAVRQFTINSLPEAAPNTSCLDILNFFQEGRSHMAMVTSEPGGFGVPVGVITLEDVIEELLGEEIVDESDVYVDVHSKIKVIRKPIRNTSMIKNLKNLLRSPALSNATTPLLGSKGAIVGNPSIAAEAGSSRMALPVETHNNYMATGKTILQSKKSSIDSAGGEQQALLDHDGTQHSCAFKTGSSKSSKESTPRLLPIDVSQHLEPSDPHQQPQYTITEQADTPGVYFKEDLSLHRQEQQPHPHRQRTKSVSPLVPLAEASNPKGKQSPNGSVTSTQVVSSATSASATTESLAAGDASTKQPDGPEGVVDRVVDGVASPAPSTKSSSKKKKSKKKSNK